MESAGEVIPLMFENYYKPPFKSSEFSLKSDLEYMQLCDKNVSQLVDGTATPNTPYILIECLIQCPKSCRKYIFNKISTIKITKKSGMNLVSFICHEFMQEYQNSSIFNIGFVLYILKFQWIYIDSCKSPKLCQEFIQDTHTFIVLISDTISDYNQYNPTRETHTILDNTFTILLTALCRSPEFPHETILKLTKVIYLAVTRTIDVVKYQCASKCCLTLARCLDKLPMTEKSQLKCPESPMLDYLINNEVKLTSQTFPNCFHTEKQRILLLTSLVNTAPVDILTSYVMDNAVVMDTIYDSLIMSAMHFTTVPDVIVQISRTLKEMIGHVNIANDSTLKRFKSGLKYTLAHLDHFVESVLHSARDFLVKFINSAVNLSHKGDNSCLALFWDAVLNLPNQSRVKLTAVAIATVHCDWCLFHCAKLPEIGQFLTELLQDQMSCEESVKVYAKLTRRLAEMYSQKQPELLSDWLRPVVELLDDVTVADSYYCQNVIMAAVEIEPSLHDQLISSCQRQTEVHDALLLKYAHFVRTKGVAMETDHENDEFWRGLMEKNKLTLLLTSQNEQIRLGVLQTIVECQKTTEEFLPFDLDLLLVYLQHNITSQSPSFRNKMLSLYRKMLRRFEASQQLISRNKNEFLLKQYKLFLQSFVRQMADNLTADANYARRCVSLDLLLNCRHLASDWCDHFNSDDVTNMWELLNDTYECNRKMAEELLSSLSAKKIGFENVQCVIDRSLTLACDVKPLKNKAAVCHFQLLVTVTDVDMATNEIAKTDPKDFRLYLLKILIERLENDVINDSNKPVYGLLRCCRELLQTRQNKNHPEAYEGFFNKLYDLCMSIQQICMPIVCNTSPEGQGDDCHLSGRVTCQTQMLLVAAWTTMKEIMFLLAEIVKQGNDVRVETIGEFFVDVFVRSRHRGVFEQAFGAFSVICQNCYESDNENLRHLPMKWHDLALSLTVGHITDDDLCSTRRSAGLPFFIMSSLSTLPSDMYEKTVSQLTSVSGTFLLIRSLNTLRFLFNNAKMIEEMTCHTLAGFKFALANLTDDIWAIRNAATLLYATLLLRTFNRNNRTTLNVLDTRHPGLAQLLFDTLSKDCRKSDSLRVYGVLLALERIHTNHNDEELVRVYANVFDACAGSTSFQVRELSAHVVVSFFATLEITKLMDKVTESLGNNGLHGILLQLKQVLKTHKNHGIPCEDFTRKTLFVLKRCGHFTMAIYMEILLIIVNFESFNDLNLLKRIIVIVSSIKLPEINTGQSTFQWARFKLITSILLNKFEQSADIMTFLNEELIENLMKNDKYLRKNSLHFMICLQANYKTHPLIVLGEVELPDDVIDFVETLDCDARNELLTSSRQVVLKYLKNEISRSHFCNNENSVLILVLLKYYINGDIEIIFKQLVTIEIEQSPDFVAGIVSCLATLFQLRLTPKINELIPLLSKCASPNAETCLRLAAAEFMSQFQDYTLETGCTIEIGNIYMVLLEDEDERVRTELAEGHPQLPSKLRSDWLEKIRNSSETIDDKLAFFIGWALRHLPEAVDTDEAIFESGESNLYAETLPITREATKQIQILLWTDGTTFLEGTINLIEILSNYSLPMVNKKTKIVIIDVLEMIVDFIKRAEAQESLKLFFTPTFLTNLRCKLTKDYHCVKYLLNQLYNLEIL